MNTLDVLGSEKPQRVFLEDVAARARAASPWLSSGLGFAAWAPRHRGPRRRRRHDLPHGHAENRHGLNRIWSVFPVLWNDSLF